MSNSRRFWPIYMAQQVWRHSGTVKSPPFINMVQALEEYRRV